jgi:hypothetical protein
VVVVVVVMRGFGESDSGVNKLFDQGTSMRTSSQLKASGRHRQSPDDPGSAVCGVLCGLPPGPRSHPIRASI